jgi:ACR3 family arsenite efflux pump ArsB
MTAFPNSKETVFQRAGYYSLYSFVMIFVFGIFIMFIISDKLTRYSKDTTIVSSCVLGVIGLVLGLVTQGNGWELYIGPHARIKHVLLLTVSFVIYPLVSYLARKLFFSDSPSMHIE